MPSLSFWRRLFAGRLALQQLALALRTQAVAAEVAVAADDTVAGYDERHRVGGAGMANCALGVRLADGAGDLAVTAGLAERDSLQFLPHPPLEGGPADVERKVDMRFASRDEVDDHLHGRG